MTHYTKELATIIARLEADHTAPEYTSAAEMTQAARDAMAEVFTAYNAPQMRKDRFPRVAIAFAALGCLAAACGLWWQL